MSKYPKIIMDERKSTPVSMNARLTVEQYHDLLHHTHNLSDIIKDIKEEVESYDDTEIRNLIETKLNDLYNKIMGITNEDATTVNEAYDTLKEVAVYIKGDGEVAAEILNKIAAVEKTLEAKLDSEKGKSLVDNKEIERLSKIVNYDDSEIKEAIKNKVDVEEGKSLVDNKEIERLAKVNNYDDSILKKLIEAKAEATEIEKIDGRVSKLEAKDKYKIESLPNGALVRIREDEIRIMCPSNTEWKKQTVGETGNANMYYMAFKAYAPEGAVSFKEGDRGIIKDEMFTFEDKFAGKDAHGNYSVCWLALASYDEANNVWTYFGKNSSTKKYIGWDYVVEWYDADGNVISADAIRINLSNEDCHLVNEPYYVSKIMAEIEELKNKLQ